MRPHRNGGIPPWCDPFIVSFEAYRRLLLLRLRWHEKAARQRGDQA